LWQNNESMDTKTGLPENGYLWILTGSRGSGKTTLCRRLAAEAKALGWDVAGVVSPAVFDGGEKTGIEVLDLRSGESRQFARRPAAYDGATSHRPSWIFDQIALAWGNQVLKTVIPCDMLIVDELGPLEFEAGVGWSAGMKALDSRSYQVGLVSIRPELLKAARQRWPFAGVVDMESAESFLDPVEMQSGGESPPSE
jgi:nucleoside-triphosphatase THEP1